MTNEQTFSYQPTSVSHPGESLKRTIDALGLNQREVARRTGMSPKHISQIINAKASITPDAAVTFERVLEVPASFWNARQKKYDEAIARQKDRDELEDHVAWLDEFPVKEMADRGLIERAKDRVERLRQLLDFFGVAGPAQWEDEWSSLSVAFRQTGAFEASRYSVAAWLRTGEIKGRRMRCGAYDAQRFEQALHTVRSATTDDIPSFVRTARREFCGAGVALVFVPELPNCRVHGATRWLSPDRALIQLSLRYQRDDIFFFTLFHEAAHVLKHGKRKVFLEVDGDEDAQEREADAFAANFLIPPDAYQRFLAQKNPTYLSHADVRRFADSLGVASSIVVGRLHHDKHVQPHKFVKDHIRSVDESVLQRSGRAGCEA